VLKRFIFAREDRPDADWLARFVAGREEADRWYLGQNFDVPSVAECEAALRDHMPELVPHYERVSTLVGDDPLAHRLLCQYRPPSVVAGCSQAVWLGNGGPALIRNYDFPLGVVTDRFEATSWSGRRVLAKAQRPWGGCLDGMNEDGLVASMTFGGGRATGLGFSIILMLRYVLETCQTVDEAVAALCRIPIAMSHNVMLLDRSGAHATLFLGPNRAPGVSLLLACTNHQEAARSALENDAVGSVERERVLLRLLSEPGMTLADLVERFLEPPLYSRRVRSPTVYSAVYRPAEGHVDYFWPGTKWPQRIDQFVMGEYTHDYGDLIA